MKIGCLNEVVCDNPKKKAIVEPIIKRKSFFSMYCSANALCYTQRAFSAPVKPQSFLLLITLSSEKYVIIRDD